MNGIEECPLAERAIVVNETCVSFSVKSPTTVSRNRTGEGQARRNDMMHDAARSNQSKQITSTSTMYGATLVGGGEFSLRPLCVTPTNREPRICAINTFMVFAVLLS